MSDLLVDPHELTKYDRTDAELQALLMFSIAVAGKTAVVIADKLDRFIWLSRARVGRWYAKEEKKPQRVVDWTPFKLMKCLAMIGAYSKKDEIGLLLRRVKLGKYTTLGPAYK